MFGGFFFFLLFIYVKQITVNDDILVFEMGRLAHTIDLVKRKQSFSHLVWLRLHQSEGQLFKRGITRVCQYPPLHCSILWQ